MEQKAKGEEMSTTFEDAKASDRCFTQHGGPADEIIAPPRPKRKVMRTYWIAISTGKKARQYVSSTHDSMIDLIEEGFTLPSYTLHSTEREEEE